MVMVKAKVNGGQGENLAAGPIPKTASPRARTHQADISVIITAARLVIQEKW